MIAVTTPARRHFAVILLFASVVRAAMLWFTSESLTQDPDAYRRIAGCIAKTGVFGLLTNDPLSAVTAHPTAFRPPLYPWLLSFLVSSEGTLTNSAIALLHWTLGMLTVAGVLYLARSMRLSLAVASCAAVMVAIDPLLLQSSSQVMTETLATFLSTAGLICWARLMSATQSNEPHSPVSTILAACSLGFVPALLICVAPHSFSGRWGLQVC